MKMADKPEVLEAVVKETVDLVMDLRTQESKLFPFWFFCFGCCPDFSHSGF